MTYDADVIAAGMGRLAGAIINKAIVDLYRYPEKICSCGVENAECVKKILRTDWFEGLCELAEKDCFAIRRNYGKKTKFKGCFR